MEDKVMTDFEQKRIIDMVKTYTECTNTITEILKNFFDDEGTCERAATKLLFEYPRMALAIVSEKEFDSCRLFNHKKYIEEQKNGK